MLRTYLSKTCTVLQDVVDAIHVKPTDDLDDFLIKSLRKYLSVKVRYANVSSIEKKKAYCSNSKSQIDMNTKQVFDYFDDVLKAKNDSKWGHLVKEAKIYNIFPSLKFSECHTLK